MINFAKKPLILFRNLLVWLCPFFLFLIILFLVAYFLGKDFEKYVALLKILIWPVTVLVILFFFRKVISYLFFAIQQFNFFGITGNLRNINDIINEEVEKKFLSEKKEKEFQIEKEKLTKETKETGVTVEKLKQINLKMLDSWDASEKRNKKTIEELTIENSKLKSLNTNPSSGNLTIDSQESNIGTGEKVGDLTPQEPVENHE
jgi:hypothetical protein